MLGPETQITVIAMGRPHGVSNGDKLITVDTSKWLRPSIFAKKRLTFPHATIILHRSFNAKLFAVRSRILTGLEE